MAIADMGVKLRKKRIHLKMSLNERWSARELRRQINSLFERYMTAVKPRKVTALIQGIKGHYQRHLKGMIILADSLTLAVYSGRAWHPCNLQAFF